MHDFISIIESELHSQQLTVADLSKRSGVSRQYLYRLLCGKQNSPSLTVVQKVAHALNLKIDISPN